jgi:deoxyribodipyrimidine photo-lyase
VPQKQQGKKRMNNEQPSVGLVWFRNNLRIHDNPALWEATQRHEQLLYVWIAEDRFSRKSPQGFDRIGSIRKEFIIESVEDLAMQLQSMGSELFVLQGDPLILLPEICAACSVETVYGQAEHTWEEAYLERELGKILPLELFESHTFIHPEDVHGGVDRTKKSFTSFRKKQESNWVVRPCVPSPSTLPGFPTDKLSILRMQLPLLNRNEWRRTGDQSESIASEAFKGVLPFKGGEQEGKARIAHYLWNSRALSTYKETRNGLIGADYSSKFSPWLAVGALSARWIYHEVKRYEAEIEANESTYWMIFELMWRDFFRFSAIRDGRNFFKFPQEQSWPKIPAFTRWTEGRTGQPFVDANMIELRETGFMSNRGRQNVASYLIHDLQLPWVLGASYFEYALIDYDACSNWGNWLYLAGIGADPRNKRWFNVAGQAERYDPDGAFQSLWLD